ncbi:MAG: alpha-L-fucosidase [Prolixibacteraceae bacterium]|jgi:alpha-L-fucosidase|nr:alpha-L-fucosidase [Prolixibacteraceae bacterium]
MKKIYLLFLIIYLINQISFGQSEEQFPNIHLDEWKVMHVSKKATYDWFTGAKYGMFIHWGLYAIPGGIWKGKTMEEMHNPPDVAEWIMHCAKIPRSEYAELAKQFNPVKFNADSIAKLAKDAGMKYLVITSKHHDGFALFDSKVSTFDVMDATPFKRDIIREMYEACNKKGLEFGIYYSHNVDWRDGADDRAFDMIEKNIDVGNPDRAFGANTWDPSPNTFNEYLQNKAYPQMKELLHNYPGMKCLWYDMGLRMTSEESYNFYKLAFDIQPQIIVTDRISNGFGDYLITGDNTIPASSVKLTRPWETVGTLNNSWGYKSYDNDWKTPKEILFWLIEIVSKGGNYMLNIGPTGEGVVPTQSVNDLKAVGKWLALNGEAIYSTEKWHITHEGPTVLNFSSTEDRAAKGFDSHFTPLDFWFTKKNNFLYAISIEKPLDKIIIKSFNNIIGKISYVEILGKGKVKFKQTNDALIVTTPKEFKPANGFVVKVEL